MVKRLVPAVALAVVATACGGTRSGEQASLVVYSGREEALVSELFDLFTAENGIRIEARYGDSAALAAQLLEEGARTPADLFFAQDGGALGALSAAGMLGALPEGVLTRVPAGFRADDGTWVGVSGRARTVVYNTDALDPRDLPDSILGFTDPSWRGRIGWVPTNASFQAFVTALRLTRGEQVAREWIRGIVANRAVDHPKNTPVVQAVAAGEIDVGFVNHYYLYQILRDDPGAPAANHFFGGGDPGALVNVAGIGILAASPNTEQAERFVEHLLGAAAQDYFAARTFEYPLVEGAPADERLPSLASLEPPALDLSDLADLEATLDLLAEEGVL